MSSQRRQPGAFGLEWDEAELDAGWQGIAALRFAPPPAGIAVELVVALARPAAGLTAAEIAVNDAAELPLAPAILPFADGATEIRLRFAVRGPRGQTRVRLLSGGDDPLHPFFSEAGFDFFVDCPAGDCHETPASAAPSPGPQPAIDLATKDFAGFLTLLDNWARASDPNWLAPGPAATETMLMELLAHHAEMLSLHQDRVVQEAFIDTARERLSLRRHAGLVGLALDEGASARAVVAVDLAAGRAGFLPAGTRFVREEGMGRITATFVSEAPAYLDADWNAGLAPGSGRGRLVPAAWPGAPDAALPEGAMGMLLLGWDSRLRAGQALAIVQGRAAHLTRLTEVVEMLAPGWVARPSDPPPGGAVRVTRIAWADPTTARFSPWADPDGTPFLLTANLVEAVHGTPRRAANEEGAALRLGGGRADLVTATDPATGATLIRALRTPEAQVLTGAAGRPALSLTVGGDRWEWQPTLMNSAGFDRHYMTETDEDGSVWLLFGDGIRGRALPLPEGSGPDGLGMAPANRRIRLDWLSGEGERGNLGAFALTGARPPEGGDAGAEADFASLAPVAATNLRQASGGRNRVSAAVARALIPESIRNPARARCVTPDDYARAAEEVPGIARAAARPLGGIFNTILVVCAPQDGGRLSADLAAAVHARLDGLRMAGREHVVRAPDPVPLDVALLICPAPGAGAAAIRRRLREALAPGSAARPGFFHPARTGFGGTIRRADMLAELARLPGIAAVKATVFRPLLRAGGPDSAEALTLGPTEIAECSCDEADPGRGRLRVSVLGTDRPPEGEGFVTAGPAPEPAGG